MIYATKIEHEHEREHEDKDGPKGHFEKVVEATALATYPPSPFCEEP